MQTISRKGITVFVIIMVILILVLIFTTRLMNVVFIEKYACGGCEQMPNGRTLCHDALCSFFDFDNQHKLVIIKEKIKFW